MEFLRLEAFPCTLSSDWALRQRFKATKVILSNVGEITVGDAG